MYLNKAALKKKLEFLYKVRNFSKSSKVHVISRPPIMINTSYSKLRNMEIDISRSGFIRYNKFNDLKRELDIKQLDEQQLLDLAWKDLTRFADEQRASLDSKSSMIEHELQCLIEEEEEFISQKQKFFLQKQEFLEYVQNEEFRLINLMEEYYSYLRFYEFLFENLYIYQLLIFILFILLFIFILIIFYKIIKIIYEYKEDKIQIKHDE